MVRSPLPNHWTTSTSCSAHPFDAGLLVQVDEVCFILFYFNSLISVKVIELIGNHELCSRISSARSVLDFTSRLDCSSCFARRVPTTMKIVSFDYRVSMALYLDPPGHVGPVRLSGYVCFGLLCISVTTLDATQKYWVYSRGLRDHLCSFLGVICFVRNMPLLRHINELGYFDWISAVDIASQQLT